MFYHFRKNIGQCQIKCWFVLFWRHCFSLLAGFFPEINNARSHAQGEDCWWSSVARRKAQEEGSQNCPCFSVLRFVTLLFVFFTSQQFAGKIWRHFCGVSKEFKEREVWKGKEQAQGQEKGKPSCGFKTKTRKLINDLQKKQSNPKL